MYHYVFTDAGKLIDTSKCLSAVINEFTICYRKNKFTPSVQEKVVHHAETIPEVALLVLKGKIPGAVFTKPGAVSIGVYSTDLINEIGKNRIITSIWVVTHPDTMCCWWDKTRGVIR